MSSLLVEDIQCIFIQVFVVGFLFLASEYDFFPNSVIKPQLFVSFLYHFVSSSPWVSRVDDKAEL